MESQPQNPEFRINPENFHPCSIDKFLINETARNIKISKGARIRNRYNQVPGYLDGKVTNSQLDTP